MRRWLATTLSLFLIAFLTIGGKTVYESRANTVPGLVGHQGNEATLEYVKRMRSIAGPQNGEVLKEFWFSSATGGDVPVLGVDDNPCSFDRPCLTWSKALELCKDTGSKCIFDSTDTTAYLPFAGGYLIGTDIFDPEAANENDIAIWITRTNPTRRAVWNIGAATWSGGGAGKLISSGLLGVGGSISGSQGWTVIEGQQITLADDGGAEHGDCFDQADAAMLIIDTGCDIADTDGAAGASIYETEGTGCTSGANDTHCGIIAINSDAEMYGAQVVLARSDTIFIAIGGNAPPAPPLATGLFLR
jgi:hypothetical protein